MDRLVELVRSFNHRCGWHQLKPSLAKRAAGRLDTAQGAQVYGGVAGAFQMRLDLAYEFERAIYLNATDMALLGLLRKLLRPGDVYVDAGSNLGLMVLVGSRAVGAAGRVYAFEPQPRAVDRLRESLELNGAHNVTLVPKGVWDTPTTATLYQFSEDQINLPSMGKRPDKTVADAIEIETVRIDDVVAEPVRVLKVDVEGAELAALRGGERTIFHRSAPHLIIELNAKTSKAFGYAPIELVDWVFERRNNYRLHLVKRRRHIRVTRDSLARLLQEHPQKPQNVWLEPIG